MPGTMAAMVMRGAGAGLRLERIALPRPGGHDVLLQVGACGVCRTGLHILDGVGRYHACAWNHARFPDTYGGKVSSRGRRRHP